MRSSVSVRKPTRDVVGGFIVSPHEMWSVLWGLTGVNPYEMRSSGPVRKPTRVVVGGFIVNPRGLWSLLHVGAVATRDVVHNVVCPHQLWFAVPGAGPHKWMQARFCTGSNVCCSRA
jgi:hypothetical protein